MTTTSAEARQSDFGAAYIGLLALSVGSVLLVGAGRVRDQAYWGDEAVTAAIVRRPLGGLVRVLWSQEAGMGPYYAALWAWSRVFGTDAGLRMFSVVGIAVGARRGGGWALAPVIAIIGGVILLVYMYREQKARAAAEAHRGGRGWRSTFPPGPRPYSPTRPGSPPRPGGAPPPPAGHR